MLNEYAMSPCYRWFGVGDDVFLHMMIDGTVYPEELSRAHVHNEGLLAALRCGGGF